MSESKVGGLVELLPCPFCGGTAGIAHRYDTDGCYWATVQCDGCGAQTHGRWASDRSSACPIFYSEVREEWNTRALSAHGQPVVDDRMVRGWRNRFISAQTELNQRANGNDYELARAYAEATANEYEAALTTALGATP